MALKYGQKRASYKNRMYDSQLERDYAIILDSHLTSKRLTEVEPQHKLRLLVNGKLITTHIVDFLVTLPDGRQKFVEVKGFPTDIWRFKQKLTEALFSETPYLVNPTDKQLFL
jgi:hypothetical protein